MRSNKVTAKSKELERYSDFTINLDLNPITAQITKITNEEAVSTSLRNLILTNVNERFYHLDIV
jgi:hypothetical protein